MKLEQQVVSLELAKRLKELGVKQESIIHWQFFKGWGVHPDKWELRHYSDFKQSTADPERELSAFTVAELGEMLGDSQLWEQDSQQFTRTFKANGLWWCELSPGSSDVAAPLSPATHREVKDTEADSRAAMLAYLLENKLI